MTTDTDILECGHVPSEHSDFTTGYGRDASGNRKCYACCAEDDRASMLETGKAMLYAVKRDDRWHITNWPGSLDFNATLTNIGRHNIARRQYSYAFVGPDRYWWTARQYGDNTQIVHCKRTKERAK